MKHDSHRQYLNGARKVSLCSKMSKKLPTFKDYLIKSDFYVKKKNKRTVSNSRTGWEIYRKLINAQCLISKHRTDFFWKINKRTCAFIRQARVSLVLEACLPNLANYFSEYVPKIKLCINSIISYLLKKILN